MKKCDEIIGIFDEYLNNKLDKESLDDFICHIKLCEDCKKDLEVYKAFFSDINIENDFAFPNDLNAKIKYKLNNIKKEKKYLFKPKIVLAYATSISFLLIIGIFGNTYMNSLKKQSEGVSSIHKEVENSLMIDNKEITKPSPDLPKPTQAPSKKPQSTPINKPIPSNTPKVAIPAVTNEPDPVVATPNIESAPAIENEAPINIQNDIADTNNASKEATTTPQNERGLLFKSAIAPNAYEEQIVNIEISEKYKEEILKKYTYIEISKDLYSIETDLKTFINNYTKSNIINNEIKENKITIKFISP
jgi:hypothetical protein